MQAKPFLNKPLILLATGILTVFILRAMLAARMNVPHTFELFDSLTILGSLITLGWGYRHLRCKDWGVAFMLGIIVGAGMFFATLFSPYPFLGIVKTNFGQAAIRGVFTTLAALGGLVVMRQGGPVQFYLTNGDWHKSGRGVGIGLLVGLPFAILNMFALQFTQGQTIQWQNPLAAMLDALQPAIVEEMIYRFALWGMLWLVLRTSLPEQAVWISGFLAMLAHNYSHFDDLFSRAPLMALGMGVVLALLWGLPTLILARCKGLEAAIAFHWIQDATRFWVGF